MKKQFLFTLFCALTFVACTQSDQSLDTAVFRRTLSANVESVIDGTRAGMESYGAFFWHEGDQIGTLMTSGNVLPMSLVEGDGGKSCGTFELNTNQTIGNYAFFPYNENSNVDAAGNLTVNFPAEYNYGSVIGEKENSFSIAMWGAISEGTVEFKHLGGVFKIYVNNLPVGDNMQFALSTTGKKLAGEFTTSLSKETPVLETSDDSENNTVVITFNNTKEDATGVFYVPVPVGTYPEVNVVVTNAEGEEVALGHWTNQTVARRAQKKGTISTKEVSNGIADGVASPEEGVYEISNLAGLKWVAEQVNQEITTFEGETVKLTADIDLGGEQWTPIGYWVTFNGTFDGQNHTISNLKHHGTEEDCYVGLFGYTVKATIKNLTIENVDLKLVANNSWAGGHLGALIGNIDGKTTIENITVKGDVKIDGDVAKKGAGRIGAVVGGNQVESTVTFKNVHVAANAGSFVKGNNSVGGIGGQIHGNVTFENCSTNLDVTSGMFFAGGIVGLTGTNSSFTNCHTSGNIAVVAGRDGNHVDPYRVGGIAGGWDDNTIHPLILTDCSYTGALSGQSADGTVAESFVCDGYVGIGYSETVGAIVSVNGVEYKYYGNGNSAAGGYEYDAEAKRATIFDAEGLSKFAEEVNGGKNFAGETAVLAADIDLAGEEWTPIGTSSNIFKGTFDGQNHTIKNLVVNGGSESNKGLFGVTHDGEIKNLVVENAKVAGRLNIGVVAGQPYTTKYTNITVKGHVEVNGLAYVGGVGGKNAYADWTNVTVEADETSYVKAHSIENGNAYRTYVGGVCGFNGEGGHKFTNITSNIDVLGSTCDVGGLFGIAHYGNKFENCVCAGNVEIYNAEEAAEAQEIGGIAGVWHNQTGYTVEFTNCSFTGTLKSNIEGVEFYYDGLVGKPYDANGSGKLIINDANGQRVIEGGFEYNAASKVAKIYDADGLKRFANKVSLDKSFAGERVVLAADIDLKGEEWKPIGMGGKHFEGIFDGQGHTIKGLKVSVRNSGSQAALFCSAAGNAEFKNFVIDEAYVKYPADNADYYASAVVGTIYGNIKFENITVKNSTITGNNKVGAIFAHDGSSTQITINNCHAEKCYIASEDTADGGCVGGLVGYFATGVAGKPNTISNSSVKNSTIVGINSTNSGKRANSEFIGCILTKETTELNIVDCVVEGNNFSQTIDGVNPVTYEGVFPAQFIGGDRNEKLLGVIMVNGTRVANKVAEVNGVKYATLQEAFNVGGNITLICDITASESIILAEGKTAVLDLNGFALNGGEESTSKHIYVIKNYGSLTIKDTKGNGSINSRGVYNYGEMILNSGKISAIDGNGGYAVNNQSGSTFVMNGGWIAADYEDGDAPGAGYDATALKVPSNATATLNGGKITNAGNFTYAIDSAGTLNIPAGSTLTIEGRHGAVSISGGVTTINAGTYSVPENTEYTDNVVYVYSSGKVIINGGTFIADNDTPNGGSCVWDSVGGATINGGVFGNSSGGDIWGTTGTVIKGGQFSTDPTEYVDTEYYKVTSNNGSYTVVARKYIYLNADHWLSDNARLVAYIWTDTISAQWHDMEAVGNTKIYRFELPDNFDYGCKIIFCRMNPSNTNNNWNNKWNQTADLKTPTNGNNMLTIPSNGWEGTNGTWSKYTPAN